jgi:hypothetical protein
LVVDTVEGRNEDGVDARGVMMDVGFGLRVKKKPVLKASLSWS